MLTSADDWALFLASTLPGMNQARTALWRATLQASKITPTDYMNMTPRRRQRAAPLPDSALTALERRLPEWKRLNTTALGEQLWLMRPSDPDWPSERLGVLDDQVPHALVGWGSRAL